jgi:hypothetical protein
MRVRRRPVVIDVVYRYSASLSVSSNVRSLAVSAAKLANPANGRTVIDDINATTWIRATPGYCFRDSAGTQPAELLDPVARFVSWNGSTAFTTGINARRPQLTSTGLLFDGVDDALTWSNNYSGTTYTVIAACKFDALSNGRCILSAYDSSGSLNDSQGSNGFAGGVLNTGNDTIGTTRNTTNLSNGTHSGSSDFVFAVRFNGSQNHVFINGVRQTGVSSSGSFNWNNLQLGARWTSQTATSNSNIRIRDLMVTSSSLTDARIIRLHKFLNHINNLGINIA